MQTSESPLQLRRQRKPTLTSPLTTPHTGVVAEIFERIHLYRNILSNYFFYFENNQRVPSYLWFGIKLCSFPTSGSFFTSREPAPEKSNTSEDPVADKFTFLGEIYILTTLTFLIEFYILATFSPLFL